MNAGIGHTRSGLHRSIGRGSQHGATTVEFALTIGLSLTLMFAIIEFAVAMYNQGVLVHATRLGAREASLFWVDPPQITSDSDPRQDQRIHRDTILDAITDWTENFVVSFTAEDPGDPVLRLRGATVAAATPVVAPGDEVRIDTAFRFRGPVTSVLSGAFDYTQRARAVMRVE
jgi:TadE-like protein